jgi:hypothetical protein
MRNQAFQALSANMLTSRLGLNQNQSSQMRLGSRRERTQEEKLSEKATRQVTGIGNIKSSSKLGGGHYSPTDMQKNTPLGV